MPSKITLRIIEGPSAGYEKVFEESATVIIGRAQDCHIRLPNDPDHKKVSRHHCLLDLRPPDISIRDLGSLHGTLVNDENIGQRKSGLSAEEAANIAFPIVRIKKGDRITLGKTVFRVEIHTPHYCSGCGEEIPSGTYMIPPLFCAGCSGEPKAKAAPPLPVCSKCGSSETGMTQGKGGEFICEVCQRDPQEVLKFLLNLAEMKKPELAALEGFSIIEELGRGGMGAVYLAKRQNTGDVVALKVMLPKVALVNKARHCFLRETQTMKILNHPNIVQLRDAGCSNGTFFITLEYCEGGTLEHLRLAGGGKLPPNDAIELIIDVLKGLEFAHLVKCPVKLPDGTSKEAIGIVHRDLKLDNLFLSTSNGKKTVKIGDFGLGKAFETAGMSGLTNDGEYAGSPFFMPRQLILDFKYAKPETDVWAAAACLYYLLCGLPPRDFPKQTIWYKVILETDPIPIRKREPAIPEALAQVVDQAIIDSPEIHFKSARDFRTALEKVR